MAIIQDALQPQNNIDAIAAPSPKMTSATTQALSSKNITNPIGAATQFQGAPQYTASKDQVYEVTGNELVSNQLNNLLSKNNPYIQRARASAAEVGNSRGLLDSSITAGAGEAAAIDAAMPIAQQDAAVYSDRGQMREQGIINSYARNQADANTANLYGVQAGYESALSKQEHGQASALQSQAADAEIRIQQINNDAEKYLKSLDIAADAQAAMIEHTRIMGQEYMVAYDRILRDPSFDSETSRTVALQQLTEVYENNLDLVAAVADAKTTTGSNTAQKPSAAAAAITDRKASGIDYSVPTPTVKTASGMDLWKTTDKISAREAIDLIVKERESDRPKISSGFSTSITKKDPRLENVNVDLALNQIEKGVSHYSGQKTFAEWARILDWLAGGG